MVRKSDLWNCSRHKGQSHDIDGHFSVYKIKSVLSVGPLMVFTFFYLVVCEAFKYKLFITLIENTD
jgi:hypothetical protein